MTLRSEYKISLLGTKSRAWTLHQVFENEEQSWTSDLSHIQRTSMTSTTTNAILNPRRTKSTHDSRHPSAMFSWSQCSTNTCKIYPAPLNPSPG